MADRRQRSYGRVLRLLSHLNRSGVAGTWVPGSSLGPGRPADSRARMTLVYGPDGWVISVAGTDGRAQMRMMRHASIRRPVLLQQVHDTDGGRREIVRMELSDFLDLLAVYTKWLAQEGRLGQDE